MLKVKSFEFSPIQENTYILYNEFNECIIIDPGCYSDAEKDTLAAFITAMELVPKMLLNTHCHLDHIFGNKFVAEKYNLIPAFHRGEKPVFDDGPTRGLMFNMPFDNFTGEPTYLEEGTDIMLGADKMKILLTPGHSPASLSFYSEKDEFVISGDALFLNSIGRTDLPGGNHELLIKSIKDKLLTLPPETIVFSGHGPTTTIGKEMQLNPFLQ